MPKRPSLSFSLIQIGQLLRSFADDVFNLNSTPVSRPNSSLFEDENVLNIISKNVKNLITSTMIA